MPTEASLRNPDYAARAPWLHACPRCDAEHKAADARERRAAGYVPPDREMTRKRDTAGCRIRRRIQRGTLKRQPCSKCGWWFGEAHHLDYDDPELYVWLCRKCHMEEHGRVGSKRYSGHRAGA